MTPTPDDRWRVLRLAEAATPGGQLLPPPSGESVDAALAVVRASAPEGLAGYLALVRALDLATLPTEGRRLSDLAVEHRARALERLAEADATGWLVRVACAPLQLSRAESPELERALGFRRTDGLPIAREARRADANRLDLRDQPHDEELEVDVVVVGTGAGGAPVAARLAERGHAVVLLEEGGDFGRADFVGRPSELQRKLYRDRGLTFALGNTLIPLPVGSTVGGTTTINSGTCYRTPADVQRRWALEHGLSDLGPGSLDAAFESVERMLGVAPSPPEALGEIPRLVARGADALGLAHGPLQRNAPGCDGQGVCCFGCPTDAKRSTGLTYVPLALSRGALLYHHAKVTRILREGGRACGVEAIAKGGEGPPRRLVVRARAVVLACGALHTPVLLMENELASGSGQLGRNLSIHPAGFAFARFDEPVRGWAGVPQGYAIEELADLGIRFEGAYPPPAFAAAALGLVGPAWTRTVEELDRLALFGFMIRDASRGRVVRGADGRPSVRYRLVDADVRAVVHAQAVLARVFLAAGAEEVRPGMQSFGPLRAREDVDAFEREALARARAHHLALSAYHPLGTCRMGRDPGRSVVSSEHEAHDVEGLFVIDGSAVPGPLGVNPQVTIMALSERASVFVERRVEGRRARTAPRRPRAELSFDETMAGACEPEDGAARFVTTLRVSVSGGSDLRAMVAARGATLDLRGTIALAGVVPEQACVGTLTIRPLAARANLVYDVSFEGADGVRWTLHGEKHAPLLRPTGMTRLHTELRRDGALFARGLLRFDVREIPAWLATFRAVQRIA
jgi:choline dehydrogenase-like flavoprotein